MAAFKWTLIALVSALLSWKNVLSLRVDGSIYSDNEDWIFLSRFCYMSKSGELEYYIQFPKSYERQHILFYYDRPTIWDNVYQSSKTCEQKKAVLDITRGQILPLSPLNSYSGCKYIQISGVDYTCEQKKAVLDITRGQILPLSPLNSYSGCKYIQISGVDYVECKDTQKFSSSRDMWWYLVLNILQTDIAFLVLYFFVTMVSMIFASSS
uniref:GPR180-like N-terminal domain-containing protein n=1 Tax=Magallana gigas TaxID=29159 RepID=K1RSZ2_MAGGI